MIMFLSMKVPKGDIKIPTLHNGNTITVGELISQLECYDKDIPLFLEFDNHRYGAFDALEEVESEDY